MGFNKNTPRQEFTASASQTEFTFNFKIFEDTNIKAYLTPSGQDADDEVDVLTLTTDYTVAINGDDGGVLTLVTPASDGDSVTILRSLEITRNTDYQSGGDFLAETIDKDQDYQTYLLADQEANTTRYLQFPTSTQNINSLLPGLTPQYYLKVNASGDGFEWAEGQSSIQNEFDTSVFRLFTGSKKISINANNISLGETRDLIMSDNDLDLGQVVLNNSEKLASTGSISIQCSSSVPSGYLECDGAELSRTTYADLFASIGVLYGVGDGSTTFNIPDLRGEFIRGWDNGRGVDSGRTIGSQQSDSYKSHNHIEGGALRNDITLQYGGVSAGVISSSNSITVSATYPYTSHSGSDETRPRNISAMFCIKY